MILKANKMDKKQQGQSWLNFLTGFIMLILPCQGQAAPVVLELFTSQGCSSCPPADKLLEELSQDKNIIALSMHVNYWDYIGWKDPFSLEVTTQRQRDYASAMGRNNVFTPQLIINGIYSVTGSDRSGVQNALSQAQPVMNLQVKNNTLYLPKATDKIDAVIEDIAYKPAADTVVMRGENAGSTLTSVNIVTEIQVLDTWDGALKNLSLPKNADGLQHVILIKDKNTSAVIGAQRL